MATWWLNIATCHLSVKFLTWCYEVPPPATKLGLDGPSRASLVVVLSHTMEAQLGRAGPWHPSGCLREVALDGGFSQAKKVISWWMRPFINFGGSELDFTVAMVKMHRGYGTAELLNDFHWHAAHHETWTQGLQECGIEAAIQAS